MHTIPASEIKRRGVAALDEALKSGPVHIIKNNRPRYVVLSEEDYRALTQRAAPPARPSLELMLERPATGASTKEEIDAWLSAERDSLPRPTIKLGVAEGRYSIPEPDADEDAKVVALFEASRIFPLVDENL